MAPTDVGDRQTLRDQYIPDVTFVDVEMTAEPSVIAGFRAFGPRPASTCHTLIANGSRRTDQGREPRRRSIAGVELFPTSG